MTYAKLGCCVAVLLSLEHYPTNYNALASALVTNLTNSRPRHYLSDSCCPKLLIFANICWSYVKV